MQLARVIGVIVATRKDANLTGITEFSGLYLYRTDWWTAARIATPLLETLAEKYGCVPGVPYGPKDVTFTQAQCDASLARLRAQK